MTRRPTIAPDAAAALLAAAPARLARKLDAEPAMAEAWTWAADDDRWTVTTDKGEMVSLAAPAGMVLRADAVACSCLLGPRCLHVVAVVARLPVADAPRAPRAETPAPAEPAASAEPAVRAAAASAFRVGAALLAGGAGGAGAVRIAELLRVIHGCRAGGAHRIAAAGARVVRSIQDLHGDRAAFSLTILTGDLAELLASSHVVATSESVAKAWLGTARRAYEPVGNLRLHGVFTEAVVARTGYAGAVTYLVDAAGHLYTRSDVAPGDVERACAAYDAPAALGDAVLSHRELGRAGLFVSGATASGDGRLGAGASVKAARAQEPSRWTDPPVAALWARPLAEQVERMIERATGDDELGAGWDLVFATGAVRGIRQGAVILAVDGGPPPTLRVVPASVHSRLRDRDTLVALGSHRGVRVRVVARVQAAAPRTASLLAVGPADGSSLELPAALIGRANAAFDALASAIVVDDAGDDDLTAPAPDPLAALRRRIERVCLGGWSTLPPEAGHEIARDAVRLEEHLLGGAAAALRDLAAAATPPGRTFAGVRRAVEATPFALAWLRAARYERAARLSIALRRWL